MLLWKQGGIGGVTYKLPHFGARLIPNFRYKRNGFDITERLRDSDTWRRAAAGLSWKAEVRVIVLKEKTDTQTESELQLVKLEAVNNEREKLLSEVRKYVVQLKEANEQLKSQSSQLEIQKADLEKLSGELRSKSAFLETVFEQLPAGVFIIEAQTGQILFSNKRIFEIFGQPLFPFDAVEDLLRISAWRSDGKPFEIHERPVMRSLRNGETILDEEFRFNRSDGSLAVVLVNSSPVRDAHGQIVAAVVIFQDITEKKKVEAELRKHKRNLEAIVSERTAELKIANQQLEQQIELHKKIKDEITVLSQFHETVIDGADVWMFVTDEKNNIVIWNRAAEKISGYSRDEVIGAKKPWRLLYPDHDQRKKVGEVFAGVLSEKKAIEDFETLIQTKSGQARTILWSARVLARPCGKKNGILAVGKDITERKEMDEKMRRYQRQLRSLASQMSLTEEKLRRKIASDLHDGLGQLLAISKIKLGQCRHNAAQSGFGGALDEIHHLIQEAIGYTRSLTMELSPPVLHELGIAAAMEWLCEQIQKQHNIRCSFKCGNLPSQLDTNLSIFLFQIIRELMHNIAKHAQACNAAINMDIIDENVRAEVIDDGVGFNMHDAALRPDYSGGFGLFNIRERLNHLGGRLEINSTLGRGTQITVFAPLKSS